MSATGAMALCARLLSKTAITALVSTRIYPQIAPQDAADNSLDYIVYHMIDETHEHHMQGASGIAWERVQLDIVAATYARAKTIANQIRLTLDGYKGNITVNTDQVIVRHCFLALSIDDFDPPTDASQRGRHRVIQDYRVGYEEQVPTFTGA